MLNAKLKIQGLRFMKNQEPNCIFIFFKSFEYFPYSHWRLRLMRLKKNLIVKF
jgi:hypothetical protein